MSLEAATYISDLSASNPAAGDNVSQGDDHIRLAKAVLQATFPNATKAFRFPNTAVTATGTVTVTFPDDFNKLYPVSAAAANRTVNLPDPSSGSTVNEDGFTVSIIKVDATVGSTVTIDGSASQTINGATTLVLRKQYEMAVLTWNKLDACWYAVVSNLGASPSPAAKTTTYAVLLSDDNSTLNCDVSGGAFTVTLPVTGLYSGFKVRIRRSSATSTTALTVAPASGTINGASTIRVFGLYDSWLFEWNGTTWHGAPALIDAEAVGTTKMWWLETAPNAKWVLQHSTQALNRTTYAELFALWSTNFGTGDGSTTFGIPNVAGYFLRAWNNAAGIDPDAASRTDRGDTTTGDKVGTKQEDALDDHTHTYTAPSGGGATGVGGNPYISSTTPGTVSGGVSGADVSTETRPKNIAVAYLLKVLP